MSTEQGRYLSNNEIQICDGIEEFNIGLVLATKQAFRRSVLESKI